MNDEKDPQGNPWIKSAMIWAGVIVALLLFVSLFDSRTATTAGTGIAYSEFRSKVQEGQVRAARQGPQRMTNPKEPPKHRGSEIRQTNAAISQPFRTTICARVNDFRGIFTKEDKMK